MATKKSKPSLAVPSMFGTAAPTKPRVPPVEVVDYDHWVPIRLATASDIRVRGLIVHADYAYWVKHEPIMHDHTFDMLVREYRKRRPDDEAFFNELGMWRSPST